MDDLDRDLSLKVVASDVGKYERESWATNVAIAPAERYVVEARFDTPGTVALVNRVHAIDHTQGRFFPETDTLGVITVLPARSEADHSAEFATLRSNADVIADIDQYRAEFDRAVDKELLLTLRTRDLPYGLLQVLRGQQPCFSHTYPCHGPAERRWFLRGFPDLVKPLPCLMPLYHLPRGGRLRRPAILNTLILVLAILTYIGAVTRARWLTAPEIGMPWPSTMSYRSPVSASRSVGGKSVVMAASIRSPRRKEPITNARFTSPNSSIDMPSRAINARSRTF